MTQSSQAAKLNLFQFIPRVLVILTLLIAVTSSFASEECACYENTPTPDLRNYTEPMGNLLVECANYDTGQMLFKRGWVKPAEFKWIQTKGKLSRPGSKIYEIECSQLKKIAFNESPKAAQSGKLTKATKAQSFNQDNEQNNEDTLSPHDAGEAR
jgi:hypothetical protein